MNTSWGAGNDVLPLLREYQKDPYQMSMGKRIFQAIVFILVIIIAGGFDPLWFLH